MQAGEKARMGCSLGLRPVQSVSPRDAGVVGLRCSGAVASQMGAVTALIGDPRFALNVKRNHLKRDALFSWVAAAGFRFFKMMQLGITDECFDGSTRNRTRISLSNA